MKTHHVRTPNAMMTACGRRVWSSAFAKTARWDKDNDTTRDCTTASWGDTTCRRCLKHGPVQP